VLAAPQSTRCRYLPSIFARCAACIAHAAPPHSIPPNPPPPHTHTHTPTHPLPHTHTPSLQAVRIVIATDNDAPGDALAEELARRLGRERCWRVRWPFTREDHEYVAHISVAKLAVREGEGEEVAEGTFGGKEAVEQPAGGAPERAGAGGVQEAAGGALEEEEAGATGGECYPCLHPQSPSLIHPWQPQMSPSTPDPSA
jgi:hypothetical protein